MQNYRNFFGCRYPIVAVAMNQVSNVDLAIAVTRAGGFASISVFNYYVAKGVIGWDLVQSELQRYQDAIGNCNFIFSFDTGFIQGPRSQIVELISKFKISHVEIIGVDIDQQDSATLANIHHWLSYLQDNGTKIILKTVDYPHDARAWAFWDNGQRCVDAIGLKGPAAAGRVMETDLTLEQLVQQAVNDFPTIPVISVGGIGTKEDVQRLMDLGVMAVGAGTIFAVSKESPVSQEAKLKMISANSSQLSKLNTDNLKQNALKFSEFNQPDNTNNTLSLRAGIKTGTQGHIFAGRAINDITEILPVNIIIESLFDQTKH